MKNNDRRSIIHNGDEGIVIFGSIIVVLVSLLVVIVIACGRHGKANDINETRTYKVICYDKTYNNITVTPDGNTYNGDNRVEFLAKCWWRRL